MAHDLSFPPDVPRVPKWHGVSFPVNIPGSEGFASSAQTSPVSDPDALFCTIGDLIQACKNAAQYYKVHVTCPADGYPVLGITWTAAGITVITGLPTTSGLDGTTYLSPNALTRVLRSFKSSEVVTVGHLGVFVEAPE